MIYTLLTSLTLVGAADAHVHHRKHSRYNSRRHHSSHVVSINWAWVIGHYEHGRWISGHWKHPAYGISHREHIAGPPPKKPNASTHWIPGHWTVKRGKRTWVRGHWSH